MSLAYSVSKNYPNYQIQDSLNLFKMSEYLTDSNILQSSKTYGRKKDRSLSAYENLHSEESSDFVGEILGNHDENSTEQKNANNASELELYTVSDMLFRYAPEKAKEQDSSISETSSPGSNYQRTRRNQKNRIQQCGSEEMSDLALSTFNIIPLTSDTDSKSENDFLYHKQTLDKQNSHNSIDSQLIHKKFNGVKSSDACGSNFPEKPNTFKPAMFFSKGASQNPFNKTKTVSILDLVNRFSASNKQDNGKKNLSKKRKNNKEACESIPVKKFGKSTVIESDIKTSPEAAQQKNPRYDDNVERSKDKTGGVNNLSAFRQGDSNTSKSVEMEKCTSVNNAGNVDSFGRVNHLSVLKVENVQMSSKTMQKKTCRTFNSSEKNLNTANNLNTPKTGNAKTLSKAVQNKNSKSSNNMEKRILVYKRYVSKNKPVKLIQSGYNEEQIEEPFEQSEGCIAPKHTHNNISNVNVGINMPVIIAPKPPNSQDDPSQGTLGIWKFIPFDANYGNISCSGPSSLIDGSSSMNGSCSNLNDLESGSDIYFMSNKINATTIINESTSIYNKEKEIFRPRTLIADGLEFQRRIIDCLKKVEDNCLLHTRKQSNEIFLKNPHLLNTTVKDFCSHNEVTDFLLDYLTGIDMDKYLTVCGNNKGYDFPENFETENLMRLIKDFTDTTISYILPSNTLSVNIPFQYILKRALMKMSNKECAILMQVFGNTEKIYLLKDVMSKLSIVALYVIFDEYKKKKMQ